MALRLPLLHSGKLRILFTILVLAGSIWSPATGLHGAGGAELIYAFRSYDALRPEKMLLVGEIRTKTKAPEPFKTDTPFLNYDNRLDFITIKVVNKEGIKVGQKLYVIDKNPFHSQYRNGLVMAEVIVRSIIHNPFYGWVITASGNLLRVREGHFVARTLDSENLEKAYMTKKEGDHYYYRGDLDRAITSYSSALEQDSTLPEAHAALGRIYFQEALERTGEDPIRAAGEFEAAWRARENFRYTYDADQFYLDYMDTLLYRYDLKAKDSRSARIGWMLDRVVEVGRLAKKGDPMIATDASIRIFYAAVNGVIQSGSPVGKVKSSDPAPDYRTLLKTELGALLEKPESSPIFHRGAILYYESLRRKAKTVAEVEIRDDVSFYYNRPLYRLYRSGRMMDRATGTGEMLDEMIEIHRTASRRNPDTIPDQSAGPMMQESMP